MLFGIAVIVVSVLWYLRLLGRTVLFVVGVPTVLLTWQVVVDWLDLTRKDINTLIGWEIVFFIALSLVELFLKRKKK